MRIVAHRERASTCKFDGSTMASVWSCLDNARSNALGVLWAQAQPASMTMERRIVPRKRGVILPSSLKPGF